MAVSINGGFQPQWSREGKELYYFNQASRSVLAVPVKEINPGLQFGASQSLASNATSRQLGFYDVAPDSKKILLNLVSPQVSQSRMDERRQPQEPLSKTSAVSFTTGGAGQ